MLTVSGKFSVDAIKSFNRSTGTRVELACRNGHDRSVVAGSVDDCEKFLQAFRGQAVAGGSAEDKLVIGRVRTNAAFHTRAVEPLIPKLELELERVKAARTLKGSKRIMSHHDTHKKIMMVSTLTGRAVTSKDIDVTYWLRQMRRPVDF